MMISKEIRKSMGELKIKNFVFLPSVTRNNFKSILFEF
jgi:hypothetical protein